MFGPRSAGGAAAGGAAAAGVDRGGTPPAFSPGPRAICTFCPAMPMTYFMSETSFGAGTTPMGTRHALHANTYTLWVSGSYEPPGQLVPPAAVPSVSVEYGPLTLLSTGGVNTGPILNFETFVKA